MKHTALNPLFLTSALAVAIAACGGSKPEAKSPEQYPDESATSGQTTNSSATFSQQVALGQQLYGENCAKCHGNAGQGSDKAPAIVGLDRGALPLDPPPRAKYRKGQFTTVADIANFVVHNMPPGKAGSLSEDQYWDILAFDLNANGIDLGDKHLDDQLASTLTVPR
ncbi:MAG TPA: cytochrome c [Polyangiaceae bacterium]|jgi:cytochrome c|nr:cytochrome c [Polyangiaceae bacterium]